MVRTVGDRSVVERIVAFNAGRDPERLALKYQAMRHDPFGFLRGTCHLFYEDLARAGGLPEAPLAWMCGDLHLENLGSFLGENGLAYFDITDFDEGILAPANWDLIRLVASLYVAAPQLGLSPRNASALAGVLIDAYRGALQRRKPLWLERRTSRGAIRTLLRNVTRRVPSKFVASRIERDGKGKWRIRCDGVHAVSTDKAGKARAKEVVEEAGRLLPAWSGIRVLDAAGRIAGTGSLGLERYVILVQEHKGRKGLRLLDVKFEPGSALAPYVPNAQPHWANEAARVLGVQFLMQAVRVWPVAAVVCEQRPYAVRELQPMMDRLSMKGLRANLKLLRDACASFGCLLAWAQLRSTTQGGASDIGALLAYSVRDAEFEELDRRAKACARQVRADYSVFANAKLAAKRRGAAPSVG